MVAVADFGVMRATRDDASGFPVTPRAWWGDGSVESRIAA